MTSCRSLRRLGDMSCEGRKERAAGGSWVLGLGKPAKRDGAWPHALAMRFLSLQ